MIEFTEDEWDDLIGPMDLYNSDKQILINYGNTDDSFYDKLEQYCKEHNLEWDYSNSVIEDIEMNIAYLSDVFGNYPNVILIGENIYGRAGFDSGYYTWSTVSENFINTSTRALPEWFPTSQLEEDGFELQSCDFANGWYGQEDDPTTILENIDGDVVFQINYSQPFEVGFCVWRRR